MSKHSVRNLLFTCSVMALACAGVMPAHANPLDGSVAAGSATIVTNGKNLDITQSSDKAVIDWRGFDIAPDESTNFYQPNSGSITLNRVNSASPSMIEGKLTANGNVFIVNKNGVVFGGGAQVDVNGLVVSTADITNENFMNGQFKFDQKGKADAKIVNQGTITAKDAGLVGFVAPNVENSGVIVANLGRVHLASGDTATVDLYGDGLMEVQASDSLNSQIVKNTGTIKANGGKVALTAAAGRDIVNSLIQADGVIHAQSVGVRNGEIIIGAKGSNKTSKSGKSKVIINGTLDVSGKKAGQSGGKVTITGDDITLSSTARIDASGTTGGGSIKIGGDYQGSGTTQTAKTLTVDSGSIITNDAIETGNGGTTILWSDGDTVFRGLITARGGSLSGNGGFAEVSGKSTLLYSGLANLSATNGEFGTLLLDPTDITISSAADSNTTGTTAITGTAATSNINVTTLQNQLASANVTISTASAFAGGGDITVLNALSWSSGRTLTLTADRDIKINAMITTPSGNNGLTMTAGRDILFNANVSLSGSGALSATATRNLTVGAGTVVTSGATGNLVLKAANGIATNTGVLTLTGNLSMGTGNLTLLSGLDGSGNSIDLAINSTNLQMQAGSFGAVSISGYRDININRAITSSNTISLDATRDLITSAALSAGSGTTYSLTAARDIVFGGNITGAGGTTGIIAQAGRNLTVNSGVTLTPSSTGAISLKAAGGVATNTGVLTINGVLNAGTSTLTLVSGLNGSGNLVDLTLNSTNLLLQGATIGTTSISGFNDILLNRSINFASTVNITANRNLTVGSGVTIASGSASNMSLNAAGGVGTNTGIFTLNGALSMGTGALTLVSGLNGSGNRADLILDNTNFLMQGASISLPSISGFRDITINRSITSSANFALTAYRNLTLGNGATLTVGSGNSINLQAAGGTVTNEGLLTLNGVLNIGTSNLTLLSGVDGSGNRGDITLNNSNFLTQGSTFGTPNITGFRDITINRDITSSGSIVLTAYRNLTVGSGVTLKAGATSAVNLFAANNVAGGLGVLTMNGILNLGSGSFTLFSGVDGSGNRTDLTLDSANILMQGTTTNAVNINGFRDITVNRALTTTGGVSVTLTADRDLALNTQIRGQSGNSNFILTSGRDMNLNANINGTGSGGINATAGRNLTVGSGAIMTAGASGATQLKAAGNVTTGTGILTINGLINAGSNSLILTSGLDASGNAVDLTLSSTNLITQGSTIGTTTIGGFNDIYLNTNMSLTGVGTFTANRNLTIGSGTTITSAPALNLTLRAANNSVSGSGIFTLNGIINMGTATLSIVSGLDGSGNRADLTFNNSNFLMQGATIAAPTISGFRDITFNRSITSSGAFGLTAARNLTIGSGVTIAGTSLTLYSAGGSPSATGSFILNGTLNAGSGNVTITSGLDTSGNRTDLTFNNTNFLMQNGAVSSLILVGFQDINLNRDLSFTGNTTINAGRNLTVGSGATITAGSGQGLALTANSVNGVGILTLNGVINMGGTGSLTLTSGTDASGNRTDITLNNSNLLMQLGRVGTTTINGFRDITINRDLLTNGSIALTAYRNLTIGNGVMLQSANNASAMTLYAANNSSTGLGVLNMNGIISIGLGNLILTSGVDASGNRTDITLDSNSLQLQGANFGQLALNGFRDINLNRDITVSGSIVASAYRNLTVGALATIAQGTNSALSLKAANGVITDTGVLTLNGKLNVGGGSVILTSGVDASGHDIDLTLDSNNFMMQGATFNGANITGFRDVTINTTMTSNNSNIVITANRNLTIGSSAVFQTNNGFTTSLKAAGGNINSIGLLTYHGKTNLTNNSVLSLLSGVDASGNRSDLTIDNTNYVMLGATTGPVSFTGFRDVNLNTNLISSQGITVVAQRDLNLANGITIQSGSTYGIVLQAAGGITTGTGLLSLNNSTLNTGSGSITLTSGLDNAGNRTNLTLDNTNFITQGSAIGTTAISGFNDITINRDLVSNGNITLNANRNLTINSTLQSGPTWGMVLYAAGGTTTNSGSLILNGKLIHGSYIFDIRSGLDSSGNRVDLTLNSSNFEMQNTANGIGNINVVGFRDVTLNTDIITAGGNTIIADRNLTIGNGVTVKSSAAHFSILQAAGGDTSRLGILTNNGIINTGTGVLTLTSGLNNSGNRADLILNNANLVTQGATIGNIAISGFRDTTIDRQLTSSGKIIIDSNRNIALASGHTLTSGAASGITLRAADNSVNNIGLLAMNGILNVGTGTSQLLSGIDASGNRLDIILDNSNLLSQGAQFGGIEVSGYRDITVNRDISSINYINFAADRNLSVRNVATGISNSLSLSAAGGDINRQGILTLNGTMQAGNTAKPLTLISGIDASGNRVDLTLNNSKLSTPSNLSRLKIEGFRDITLDTDIILSPAATASTSTITASRDIYFNRNLTQINSIADTSLLATAGRDIIIGTGAHLTGGTGTTIVAGRNFINSSGASALSVNSGRWLVYSANPEGIQTSGLAYNFQSFGCSYGNSCTMGSGNGFLYKQSQAEHDYNQVRSEFKDLPKTVEYVSQIPVVSYTSTVPIKTAYNDLRNNHSIYTIDKALSLQLQLDSDDTE